MEWSLSGIWQWFPSLPLPIYMLIGAKTCGAYRDTRTWGRKSHSTKLDRVRMRGCKDWGCSEPRLISSCDPISSNICNSWFKSNQAFMSCQSCFQYQPYSTMLMAVQMCVHHEMNTKVCTRKPFFSSISVFPGPVVCYMIMWISKVLGGWTCNHTLRRTICMQQREYFETIVPFDLFPHEVLVGRYISLNEHSVVLNSGS